MRNRLFRAVCSSRLGSRRACKGARYPRCDCHELERGVPRAALGIHVDAPQRRFPRWNPALQIVGVPGLGFDTDENAGIGGGHFGYQHQFGMLVIGAELGMTALIGRHATRTTCPKQTIALFGCSSQFSDTSFSRRAGGRAGRWAIGCHTWLADMPLRASMPTRKMYRWRRSGRQSFGGMIGPMAGISAAASIGHSHKASSWASNTATTTSGRRRQREQLSAACRGPCRMTQPALRRLRIRWPRG